MKLRIIKDTGEQVSKAAPGCLASEALRWAGVPVEAPCAGRGTCKKCVITVHGAVSEPSQAEHEAFSAEELAQGRRLACQVRLFGEATLWPTAQGIMTQVAAGQDGGASSSPMYRACAISLDIGTTTLCMQLCTAAGVVAQAVRRNPQTAFGADVISRMEAAMEDKGHALAACLWRAIGEMVSEVTQKASVSPQSIDGAVFTGNTAMLYLLTERNPRSLAVGPFVAEHLFGETVSCAAWQSDTLPLWKNIYFPPCICAFVGADITTAILASRMCERDETALLLDIGTNGEMALWTQGRLLCCSTAAGPAFEGGGLTYGVCGVPGAIDHISIENGNVAYTTIDGAVPIGICGSGIVDVLAVMLTLGVIDETGAFPTEEDFFALTPDVGVTGADVRMLQLAKGSLRAGMETLLKTAGVPAAQVARFYLAGGFGSYLNLNSAAKIGLIAPEWLERVHVLGNAAHTGATKLLQDKTLCARAQEIAEMAQPVALHDNALFSEYFIECMLF